MRERRMTICLNSAAKICLGVLFLILGGLIYLLFRSKTLYIYIWCESLGFADLIDSLRLFVHDWIVPDFIIFSLPDGLYCAAYLLIIEAIWHEEKGWIKNLTLSVVPLVTISSEILQFFGIVRGTFDIIDLLCYMVSFLAYTMILFTNNYKYNFLKTKL